MARKRSGLVSIGEVFSDLSGPQSRRPVELLAEDYREITAAHKNASNRQVGEAPFPFVAGLLSWGRGRMGGPISLESSVVRGRRRRPLTMITKGYA